MNDAFINLFSNFLLVCNLFLTMTCWDICGVVFALKNNLGHIFINHKENDPAPFQKCDQCDYKETYTNLMQHKENKYRENRLKCSICPSEFN